MADDMGKKKEKTKKSEVFSKKQWNIV